MVICVTIFESFDGGRDYYCLILRLCSFIVLSVHKSFKDLHRELYSVSCNPWWFGW